MKTKVVKKRRVGRSIKRKGNRHEIMLADKLSEWWYGKTGYLWRASSESRKNRNEKSKGVHTGDIVPINNPPYSFPFHVQAKHYKADTARLFSLLTMDSSPILKYWEIAVKSCRYDLYPVLIYTENRRGELVFADQDLLYTHSDCNHITYSNPVTGDILVGMRIADFMHSVMVDRKS